MLICNKCGDIVEVSDLPTYCETYEIWGSITKEIVHSYDCKCGGEFVNARTCSICGNWFCEDELDLGVCENCKSQEDIND